MLPAEAAVATMRDVHGAMPWTSLASSTMHLDSHDTPRFRTVTGGGIDGWHRRRRAGPRPAPGRAGLQMTMPGVPVVFMGDELGLTGVDGEHARTPYPWQRRDDLGRARPSTPTAPGSRLRREHVALRRGGLRWLHAAGDSMTYLREHPDQTLLVHATRDADQRRCALPRRALGPARDVARAARRDRRRRSTAPTRDLPGDGPGVAVYVVVGR